MIPPAPIARTLLEICVDDCAGIAAAVAGGADRLELCAGLELGGITPSEALIDRAVASGLPVHVLVRPRAGSFLLSPDEVALIVADIRHALAHGAAGVVVGALTSAGTLDTTALARFRDAAGTGKAVLHRAVDLLPDPAAALPVARALGYDGVLSSGGAVSARDGAAVLRRMIAAAGPVQVIAGAGLRPDHARRLVDETGVGAVHGSAGGMGLASGSLAAALGLGGVRRSTDRMVVAALRTALDGG